MEELAAYVCTALNQKGIETVLSGGCCVQIYSQGRYTSDDIDLIDRFNGGHRRIREVMESLGFREHKMKLPIFWNSPVEHLVWEMLPSPRWRIG